MIRLLNSQSRRPGRTLVIGAGVAGLTTAVVLRRLGMQVTILADRFAPHVTSIVAGALWEWPPAVCGHIYDPISVARSKAWSRESYTIFRDLANNSSTGVHVRPVTFYFRSPIADDPIQHAKMEELRDQVLGFEHRSSLIEQNGINPNIGMCDAYSHLAPMIDTETYLRWLLDEAQRMGCTIQRTEIIGSLRTQADELLGEHQADCIVNCTGLRGGELGDETTSYPVRGALIRICNDGKAMPKINQAHCVSHDGNSEDPGFIFVLPRGNDRLVLGGFAEPNQSTLDINFGSYEPIREMYRRCVEFLPALRHAEIDAAEPIKVGLRPFRSQGVRLEMDPEAPIIHNYGHGGSGVTLSWGCANDVARILSSQAVLAEAT